MPLGHDPEVPKVKVVRRDEAKDVVVAAHSRQCVDIALCRPRRPLRPRHDLDRDEGQCRGRGGIKDTRLPHAAEAPARLQLDQGDARGGGQRGRGRGGEQGEWTSRRRRLTGRGVEEAESMRAVDEEGGGDDEGDKDEGDERVEEGEEGHPLLPHLDHTL